LLRFPFSLVDEAGDAFLEVPLLQVDGMGTSESGQGLYLCATTPVVGEQDRLGAQRCILGSCGLHERSQFRNLLVVEPFYTKNCTTAFVGLLNVV